VFELRVRRAERVLTERWQQVPVWPRGEAMLGLSYRPLQARALGLDPDETLDALLGCPYQLIRLAAYWNEIEPHPGTFDPAGLDRQIGAAERAGKRIIVCVGPLKSFGYPEFFVPAHYLSPPLTEGSLVRPQDRQPLLDAATGFVTRLVRRYAGREAIVAWQVEHEAVDPLGMEHSWRLSEAFARAEADAVRAADPGRPVVMNGFLPTSLPVRLQQWWRTRDQGDSLAVAQRLADIVGVDFYPRHALARAGPLTMYLDGSRSRRPRRRRQHLLSWAAANQRRIMIAEGQAEPWEAVTTPPDPGRRGAHSRGMYSCLPEHVIQNYNDCLAADGLWAYLFWGAEYWVLRQRHGDPSYLRAFERVLTES
jgi:Beta-galactosidase